MHYVQRISSTTPRGKKRREGSLPTGLHQQHRVSMYQEHFGFTAPPFSIAPDPRYLYMSARHREALAHLLYGINSDGGFVLLTGEVGTGKTTVCRCLLEQIPKNTDIAFILNPKLTVQELLATVCEEFGIDYPEGNAGIKVFIDRINAFLLAGHAEGRRAVLIIDEAQNLSADVLEQLRLLTNLETYERKLLQIILLGQPELKDLLSRPELRQLAQRVTARYHLEPLSKKDVGAYVAHRLSVAGASGNLFPMAITDTLFRLSGGVPRLINLICDRALLGAYAKGHTRIDKPILTGAAREVYGAGNGQRRAKKQGWLVAALVVLCGGAVLAAAYYGMEPQNDATMAPAPAAHRQAAPSQPQEPEMVPAAQANRSRVAPLQWPAAQQLSTSKNMAFQALFKQWNISYIPEEHYEACQYAQTQGLGCLHLAGSLESLLHLNRPAVLTLHNDQGVEFHATLTAVHGQTATFQLGTETQTVVVEDLWKHWFGDYTLLWSMPPEYQGVILPGDQGPVVAWLANKLARIRERPFQPLESHIFDTAMINEVKHFQFSRNLVPDGVVGPQTIIHLNSAAGAELPTVIDAHEDN